MTPIPDERRLMRYKSCCSNKKKFQKENRAPTSFKWQLTNKRRYSRGENGAALNNEGHACSHQNCNVSSNPGEGEGEVCGQTERKLVSNKPDETWPEQTRSFYQSGICAWAFSVAQQDWWTWRASLKQQGGCTCVAHQASPSGQMCWLSNRLEGACRREVLSFFIYFFTCVEHLLDDHSHLPLQHGVEQLDDEDEAGAEDEQRQSQENEAHCQVWQISVDEEVVACNGRSKRWLALKCPLYASNMWQLKVDSCA